MATISKLAINLGWNGQQAEAGLSRTAKKTTEAGQAADGASSAFGRLAQALKGANDVKSGFEMLRGVTQFFIGAPIAAVGEMIKLGGELETMQVKMGLLAGSFDKGAESLENLRQITRDMGVPLNEVVSGFQQLTTAGVDTGSAEKLMRTFANVAPLLGEGGLGRLAGGISEMVKSGVAEASTLQQMQASGLKVYEALAQRLSNVTGQFHSVEDAIDAVNNKTVQASTAVLAMQDAVKTPEAIDAAQRLFNSFEGQLSRLQQGVIELFRDIGKGLIDGLDIPAFLASLRGVVEGISIIVKEISKGLLEALGPAGEADRLQSSFQKSRDFAFQIAEIIAKTANDFAAEFQKIIINLETMAKKVTIVFDQGVSGLISGETNALLETRQFLDQLGIKQAEQDRVARENQITAFFDNIKKGAGVADIRRANDLGLPKGGAPLAAVNIPQRQLASAADFSVQRLQAGSTAAVEAMVRNQLGGGQDKQDQMVAELKEQTRQGAALVAAMAGIKMPAIAVLPN